MVGSVMKRVVLLMVWILVFLLTDLALDTALSQTTERGIALSSALDHPLAQKPREISRTEPIQVQLKAPPPTLLEYGSQAIICLIGISGIFLFFFRGKLEIFKDIKIMTFTVNTFMSEYMTDVLKGFEKLKLIKKGRSDDWAKATSAQRYAEDRSPKKLNSKGTNLLRKSGIQQIVDDNLLTLMEKLDSKNPESPLDVEENAYLAVKSKSKEQQYFVTVKNYVFTHPPTKASDIIFVGSLYLRDKYLMERPKLQVDERGDSKFAILVQKIKDMTSL